MFLSLILFLQIDEKSNYNVFFLEAPEELRLVGENYRGGGNFGSDEDNVDNEKDLVVDKDIPISKCYAKHTSILYNANGKILKTVDSTTNQLINLQNEELTPLTLTLVDKNEVATKLKVELMAYCEESTPLRMLDSSDLTVRVYSTDRNYDEILTINEKVNLDGDTKLNTSWTNKWSEYGNLVVDLKTINDRLEKSDSYNSGQRIEVTGNMKIGLGTGYEVFGTLKTWSFNLIPGSPIFGSPRDGYTNTQNSHIELTVTPTASTTNPLIDDKPNCDYTICYGKENEDTHTEEQQAKCEQEAKDRSAGLAGAYYVGVFKDNKCTLTITDSTPAPEPTNTAESCEIMINELNTKSDSNTKFDGSFNGKFCDITRTTVTEKIVDIDDKELPDYGILNYKKLLNCDSADCFNDADFLPIYALFGAILLLGVFQTKQQSRVVMMS